MGDYEIERAIRRACEAQLPALSLPVPFHLDTFHRPDCRPPQAPHRML